VNAGFPNKGQCQCAKQSSANCNATQCRRHNASGLWPKERNANMAALIALALA
jgi:hypothetical protein